MKSKKLKSIIYVAGFALTLILGSGSLFSYLKYLNDEQNSSHKKDLVVLEFYEKLNKLESDIALAAEEYFKYEENKKNTYILISSINAYNKIEAKLSSLESRPPRFFNLNLIFPKDIPRENTPKIISVKFDEHIFLQIEHDENGKIILDEIERSVEFIVGNFDKNIRSKFYQNECNVGAAKKCTDLAIDLSGYPNSGKFTFQEIELFTKGCRGGDPFGCEILSFYYFDRADLDGALWAGEKACNFNVSRACGFLGSMYASDDLGRMANYEMARLYLSKGCLLRNGKSCYYSAYLQISGHVKEEESRVRNLLKRGCFLGDQLSCIAEDNYKEFSICGNKRFLPDPDSSSVGLKISCL